MTSHSKRRFLFIRPFKSVGDIRLHEGECLVLLHPAVVQTEDDPAMIRQYNPSVSPHKIGFWTDGSDEFGEPYTEILEPLKGGDVAYKYLSVDEYESVREGLQRASAWL